MYEFYPEGFVPDDEFNKRAEMLRRRNFLLLWVENPEDNFKRWRWTGCSCPGCISIGQYKLFLRRQRTSDSNEIKFNGMFMSGGIKFNTSEIVLSLSTGVMAFSISCPWGCNAFEALGAQIRYIMPADSEFAEKGKPKKSAAEFSNTLLKYTGKSAFNITLDMNGLFDPKKTFISLPKEKFDSNLTDRAGDSYVLEPLNDAALVFARFAHSVCFDRKSRRQTTVRHDFYLSYSGSFRINDSREILPGLYGMEYMRGCDEITFCPGHSAFLGAEFPDYGNGAVTSWVSLRGDYYSMPESMPLYAPKNGILQTYETPAAVFSQPSKPVPFFPWSNTHISDNLNVNEADDVLYRVRCSVLAEDIEQTQLFSSENAEVTAVTPAGLCVGIDNSSWRWLGIAQTSAQPLPNVRINGITPEGKKKLLQKDCFIVITSKEEYLSFGSGDLSVSIDGWIIKLSEDEWNDSILIIKYCTGISVRDRLYDNPVFKRLLDSAYVGTLEKENFKGFIDAVSSERFEGVMLLNTLAEADKSKLSPEVYAAVAMTGEKYLNCAYAAIKRSKVDMINGNVNVALSQTDALIAYDSGGILQSDKDSDFTCKTVALEVIIQNSRVTSFTSRTEILPKRLLGERLSQPECIALLGRAEIENGIAVYRFSPENDVRYIPQSKPVEAVVISGVSMSAGNEQSRFILSGSLALTCEEKCDIFSFDELGFEGAAIVCNSENAYEELSGLRLCLDRSKAREGSVVEVFGACAEQYIGNSAAKSPEELGFLSITTPVRQGEIGTGWNGIIQRLALGKSGGLGADSPLYFDFICAWKDGKYYFGIQLRGVFSKQFTLQNLLNVGFQSVSLIKSEKGAPMFKLNSLTLKILGLSVPPKSADLFIFGDRGKVGWFFGYSE
ncbi:MAG: hypothetical protein HDQ97_01410 [Lachnospiraceae bacterium]|nr:hypothetical protein [Lachnospiraceae bacterium]